jgi:hypothetical protein
MAYQTWLSIDPANTSGITRWINGKPKTYILKKIGNKGRYSWGKEKFDSRYEAWKTLLVGTRPETIVVEEGCGRFTTAIKAQAELRGYIRGVADSILPDYNFEVINVSEWRRVIKEAYGVSFPADSARCKKLAQNLVKEHFGLDCSEDEADSVLLGVAAQRMGLVN